MRRLVTLAATIGLVIAIAVTIVARGGERSEPLSRQARADRLVPAGARAIERRRLTAEAGIGPQIVVTWKRPIPGGEGDAAEYGASIGQLGTQGWRRVFAFRIPAFTRASAFGLDLKIGDFTDDGHDDVLFVEQRTGTAGAQFYRAVATVAGATRELFSRRHFLDDGTIRIHRGGLVMTQGVGPSATLHCCAPRTRVTFLKWNGRAVVAASTSVRANHGPWPPSQLGSTD
jgi:hypothetical protein